MENHPSRNWKWNFDFCFHLSLWFFLVKQVPGQGPEQRESEKTTLSADYYIIN
jgi:hypothetical protein